MSATMRHYLKEQELLAYDRGYSAEEMKASELRKNFFKKFIVDFDTDLYKSQVERDWAKIAKREFRYDVQMKSVGYGFFWGNLAWSASIFARKRMTFWPLFSVWAVASAYYYPIYFQVHNKKFFDMCNVGEQYYLGAQRNAVLNQCNAIQDREDF